MPLEITEGEVWDVVIDRPFQDMAMKKKKHGAVPFGFSPASHAVTI